MSAPCHHADTDAFDHPECAGCRLLVAQRRPSPERPDQRTEIERPERARLRDHRADRLIVDDPAPRPSLLAARDLTPEERAAQDEDPRPGVWVRDQGADLRELTQDQTDALIRRELWQEASSRGEDDMREVEGVLGKPCIIDLGVRLVSTQRGGIDSDLLVRVLAHRAWGDRDRQWFELRGVRKGDRVRTFPFIDDDRASNIVVAWPGERAFGTAQHDARSGERVAVVDDTGEHRFRVSDRPRQPLGEIEIDAKPTDGPDAPVVVDGMQCRITRVSHTKNGSRAWCVRGRLSPEYQGTYDRYWLGPPPEFDEAEICEQFGFQRWEAKHHLTHMCVVITAWRGSHHLELTIAERELANSPYESIMEACSQLSGQLGPRR
jgi:hypothetical protein